MLAVMAPSSHAWRCVGLLLSLLAAGSEASIKWAPLACPKARPASGASEPQPQCTQPSLSASEDSVVSLFMQVELTGGGGLGGLEAFDRAFEAKPKPKAASTVASTDGGQGMAEKRTSMPLNRRSRQNQLHFKLRFFNQQQAALFNNFTKAHQAF